MSYLYVYNLFSLSNDNRCLSSDKQIKAIKIEERIFRVLELLHFWDMVNAICDTDFKSGSSEVLTDSGLNGFSAILDDYIIELECVIEQNKSVKSVLCILQGLKSLALSSMDKKQPLAFITI